MKRIVVDLDDTLTVPGSNVSYIEKEPNADLIDKIRIYKSLGFEIIIQTARSMRTHNNSIGKINAKTLPIVVEWLDRHGVPYDEIHVGKPWCGFDGFYIDDRAIRPAEFLSLSYEQIVDLLDKAK